MVDRSSTLSARTVKYAAIAVAALMAGGIVTLMVLARGTGEDITGIVSPALLITIISVVGAAVAAVAERRAGKSGDLNSQDER